jgi:hypothetical protein
VYESEKELKNADILKEIQSGAKLRHVKCNDRSKPFLKGTVTQELASPSVKVRVHKSFGIIIKSGEELCNVKCNNSSKPFLKGMVSQEFLYNLR